MECRKPAAIDRATALRYMGASGWTPDAATAALLDKAEQTVLTAAAPRAVYRRLPRTALPLENCGSDLTRHLQGCDEVLLLAATLGAEVDKLLRKWLDTQDVCQTLNICPRTVQTLRDNGTLAYTQISHKTYYKPEDVMHAQPCT